MPLVELLYVIWNDLMLGDFFQGTQLMEEHGVHCLTKGRSDNLGHGGSGKSGLIRI